MSDIIAPRPDGEKSSNENRFPADPNSMEYGKYRVHYDGEQSGPNVNPNVLLYKRTLDGFDIIQTWYDNLPPEAKTPDHIQNQFEPILAIRDYFTQTGNLKDQAKSGSLKLGDVSTLAEAQKKLVQKLGIENHWPNPYADTRTLDIVPTDLIAKNSPLGNAVHEINMDLVNIISPLSKVDRYGNKMGPDKIAQEKARAANSLSSIPKTMEYGLGILSKDVELVPIPMPAIHESIAPYLENLTRDQILFQAERAHIDPQSLVDMPLNVIIPTEAPSLTLEQVNTEIIQSFFDNAVQNAVKAQLGDPDVATKGVQIELRYNIEPDGKAQIIIGDHGKGLPDNLRQIGFNEIKSSQWDGNIQGTAEGLNGLGIAINILGGKGYLRSREDGRPGAEAVIEFPSTSAWMAQG